MCLLSHLEVELPFLFPVLVPYFPDEFLIIDGHDLLPNLNREALEPARL